MKATPAHALSILVALAAHGASRQPQACRTAQLQMSFPIAFAATGHEGGYLRFVNTSRERCLLSGWPRVVVIEANGRATPVARQTVADMWLPLIWPHARRVPRLILRPGYGGIAELQDGDVPPDGRKTCPSARLLRVGAPGDRHFVTISARLRKEATYLPLCYPPGVSPVVPLSALAGQR